MVYGFFIRLETFRIILYLCLFRIYITWFMEVIWTIQYGPYYTVLIIWNQFRNIYKCYPFLLLMRSCKIAKTIIVDKIIINTNSVSNESLTSSRFKIGNLLLWFSLLVIFEKKWFFNWDQNAKTYDDCKNKGIEFCDHVPEQILIRTNKNFRSVELGHLMTETQKQSGQSHVMHSFLQRNSPTASFCQKIFSIVLSTSELSLHINQSVCSF